MMKNSKLRFLKFFMRYVMSKIVLYDMKSFKKRKMIALEIWNYVLFDSFSIGIYEKVSYIILNFDLWDNACSKNSEKQIVWS